MAPIKSQLLTGLTMAEPVILTMKNAFFQESLLKHRLLRACYLGFHQSAWIVLITSEILIMTRISLLRCFLLTVASAKFICKIHSGSNDNVITLKPRFTHTRFIRTPRYYGEFALSPGKESPVIFSKFNPLNTAPYGPLSVRIY